MVGDKYLYAKRRRFNKNRKFDRAYLESLRNALVAGGFTEITVKLPHNLIDAKAEDEISIDEFLKRERNYPSQILVAVNPDTKEVMKALYVNISTKAFFKDNTFPSGHSEPAEFYVLAKPDRLHPIFDFYYSRYFTDPNPASSTVQAFIGIFSVVLLMYYGFAYFAGQPGYFTRQYGIPMFDYVVVGMAILVLFLFFNQQTGLYVKEKEFRPAVWVMRALKGEFRDNPLVNFFITIVGGTIVLLIGHYVFQIG